MCVCVCVILLKCHSRVAMLGDLGSKGGMVKPKESSYAVGVRVKETGLAVATFLVIVTLIWPNTSSASASSPKNEKSTTEI